MPAPSIRRAQAEYLSQLLCGLGDGAEHGNHCSDTTSIQNEWGQAVRPIAKRRTQWVIPLMFQLRVTAQTVCPKLLRCAEKDVYIKSLLSFEHEVDSTAKFMS